MSTLLLIPGPFGGLRLYRRRADGTLWPGPTLTNPLELRSCVGSLPSPRTIVLCGQPYADPVSEAILDLADLYVVPGAWLRHLPRHDELRRADLAVRLVAAHRCRPIEHRVGPTAHADLPF